MSHEEAAGAPGGAGEDDRAPRRPSRDADELAPAVAFEVLRVKGGIASTVVQAVAAEVPCTIVANGVELATLACTPDHLRELAAGFLYTAGFMAGADDLRESTIDTESWTVTCTLSRTPDVGQLERRLYAPGCGRGLLYTSASEALQSRPLTSSLRLAAAQVAALAGWVQHSSSLFRETGCVHTAAISLAGDLPAAGIDDIARHCAVDKAIGSHLLAGQTFERAVLACSGRISSDTVSKARRAGIPVIVARGGPTHQAVLRARAWGVTLVGFARGRDFTVYSHAERVAAPEAPPQLQE